jgi:hypothetical protein
MGKRRTTSDAEQLGGVEDVPECWTLEERQMFQLRDYLAYPRWRAETAVYILAGLDPELTMGSPGAWGLKFLPGGIQESWKNWDGTIEPIVLEHYALAELEDVSGFIQGESRSPLEWMAHAKSKGYEPPWLALVMKDPETRCLLGGTVSAQRKTIQQLGGLAARDATPQFKAKSEMLREWDRQFKDGISPQAARHFGREMIRRYCDCKPPIVSVRVLQGWIRDLRREKDCGEACVWAEALRGSHA